MKKSFNIKYDLNDLSIYDAYIATKSHTQIINNILHGVLGSESKSHIAYGPYGTGKSYISTLLTNLLGRQISKKNLQKIKADFSWFDLSINSQIDLWVEEKIKYLPVVLNGYEADFNNAILRQISLTLKDNNIKFTTRNSVSIISNHILIWEKDYPETYSKFQSYLEINKLNKGEFLSTLEIDDKIYDSFLTFFKDVSSGAEISLFSSDDLISMMEELKDVLNEKNLGLFLIYDEFGRYLQNIETSQVSKFFGQIQNLAELSNKSKNISLLLITHKPVNYYFRNLANEQKLEYEKIEKRFTVNEIKSDVSTYVKVVLDFIRNLNVNQNYNFNLEHHLSRLKLLDIFDNNFIGDCSLIDIIENIYPIHPLTLFLLPKFSSIFGQNERTLFTFLQDQSSSGLLGFIKSKSKVYSADLLVDYFFSGSEDEFSEGLKEVNLYKKIYQSLGLFFDEPLILIAQRILKFTLIWNITKSYNISILNQELISYALDLNKDEVRQILDTLVLERILRINLQNKHYEIIESSNVNIEKLISQNNINIINKVNTCEVTLNKYNPLKYIYPDNFNAEHDTIRFARVNLFLNDVKKVDKLNDLQISIVFSNTKTSTNDIDCLVGNVVMADFEVFKSKLLRLHSIEVLLNDEKMLNTYKNLDIDLEYEKNIVINEISNIYEKIYKPNVLFVYNNIEFEFANVNAIELFVEDKIRQLFYRTLIIHNDQINKFIISKQQENATIQLINDIIINKNSEFVIDGSQNGPKTLIKYSLDNSINMQNIIEDVREYLILNENGKLSDITQFLSRSPYGIRPTLTPLIMMYSIISYWKNLMFFKDGDYIPNLKGDYIYRIGLGNFDCVYNFSNFDFNNKEFLENIIQLFGDVEENMSDKSLGIKVCSSLYNWYINLPIITQLDNFSNNRINSFLRLIELSKTNPRNSLFEINENFELNEIESIKKQVDTYFEEYLKAIENEIMNELDIDSWKSWSAKIDNVFKRTEKLAQIASKNEETIIRYAQTFEKLEIRKWPKSMFEVLKNNIRHDYAKIMYKSKTTSIFINDKEVKILDIDLSDKAVRLKSNIQSQIQANQKYLSKSEIEKLIILLMEEYIK